jgi:hypothetical protein
MPSITLKDIPEELLDRLREAASRERRSIAQQALLLIEGGLDRGDTAETRAERQVTAWKALMGRWRSRRSMRAEVKEIYGARTIDTDEDR